MSTKEEKARNDVVDKELDVVYGVMDLGVLDVPREDMKRLRLSAEGFEEIMSMLSDRILEETDLKEEEEEFIDTLQTALYAMYNMVYIVEVYLEGEDFAELEGLSFERVWGMLSIKDKEFLVASYLRLGDILVVYYGVYILMNQLENKNRSKRGEIK